MHLSPEHQQALKLEHGICADEACDTCGKILGSVRFTRQGDPGEWCSRECRDGQAQAAATKSRIERKRVGRPRVYATPLARRAAERRQSVERSRAYRNRLSVTEKSQQPADCARVTDAIFAS